MAKRGVVRENWGRSYQAVPEWAQSAAALVALCMAPPVIPRQEFSQAGIGARQVAACDDLARRFAAPVRVVEVRDVRIVSVLDVLVFVHNRRRRHVCAGAWRPDGTVEFNFLNRIEIGRPFAGFAWLDVLIGQWRGQWPGFLDTAGVTDAWGRVRNALKRWVRESVDMRAHRRMFGEALQLDARAVWMAERLERPERPGWLYADRYNAVGRHYRLLERALADSAPLFRLVGAALLSRHVADPAEPVAATLRYLRAQGISEAAWRAASRCGPRLFDCALKHATNRRLFEVCVETLRMLDIADLKPVPDALQCVLYLQHAPHASGRLMFKRAWCSFPAWFLRSAARAAREAEARGELRGFIDDNFLPAVNWLAEARPRPDANQIGAGWRWIERARVEWERDPRLWWCGRQVEWKSAFESGDCMGYQAFALRDAQAVVDEGRAMHHCVANYIDECARGRLRVFSLRDPNTGERSATAMLRRMETGYWRLDQVRERMNRGVTGSVALAAQALCLRYGAAELRLAQVG